MKCPPPTFLPHIDCSMDKIVCYYTNWSVYRPGSAKFNAQNINPYLCTHLIYAFGGFNTKNELKPFDKYQDIEKGGYSKFIGLKTYNKNLKTLLAIGGWNEGSARFSSMVSNPDSRKQLVRNAIKFLRQNRFDGLDLDWEYPSFRDGSRPQDKDNYAQLVKELREEFERESEKTGRPRLLLTMAVPAGIDYIAKGYDIPKLSRFLDWMNLLTYDYHSSFEPATNHHAPLFATDEPSEYNYETELNIDYTIKKYLEAGAEPEKLVLGIPTYGRSYTLFNPDSNEIGAPADGPGDKGEATRENGYLAYYEICENIKTNNWIVMNTNAKTMGPYAYKNNQWVSYDDIDIVRAKAKYAVDKKLGGIMFWSIDNDDFRGECHGRPFPLIEAGKETFLAERQSLSKQKSRKHDKHNNNRLLPADEIEQESQFNYNLQKATNHDQFSVKKRKNNRKRLKTNRNTVRAAATTATIATTTPSYTTPAPPPTADPAPSFQCEDEGFFPNPTDCKKYYWCLSSGPSNLGIVAHQFTCPSGLFFNKATDSCDYSQNVFCKKTKVTTTTTTTTTTTKKPMVASTIKTTTTTTTTPAPDSNYDSYEEAEAEDDDYEEYDDESTNNNKFFDSIEDPKVIKDLVNLVKKLGGVDKLEKHFSGQDNDDVAATTPVPLAHTKSPSRRLYERVLRNQNTGQDLVTESNSDKSFHSGLKYVTINRNRTKSTATTSTESLIGPETRETTMKSRYVTINRNRLATTTVLTPRTAAVAAAVNEDDDGDEDDYDDQEDPDDDDLENNLSTPEINLLATANPVKNSFKYNTIIRTKPFERTTEPISHTSEQKSTSVEVTRRRPTTTTTTTSSPVTTGTTSSVKGFRRRTRPSSTSTTAASTKTDDTVVATTRKPLRKSLFPSRRLNLTQSKPRPTTNTLSLVLNTLIESNSSSKTEKTRKPFLTSTTTTTTTVVIPLTAATTTTTTDIDETYTNNKGIDDGDHIASIVSNYSRTNIYKPLTTRKPKPFSFSNGKRRFFNETIIVADQVHEPSDKQLEKREQLQDRLISKITSLAHSVQNMQRVQDTITVRPFNRNRQRNKSPVLVTYKKPKNLDLATDVNTRHVPILAATIPRNSKVIVMSNGEIQCLDQGNFPHPLSCRKFISCARLDNGILLGWEYACPAQLSFDPVGQICNWASELKCHQIES